MQEDKNINESVSQLEVLSNNCPPRQQLNEELEARVEERTAELNSVIVQLREEVKKRIEIENKLRSSEQFLHLVIDSIPQLIFWKDKNSVYLGCNQKFADVAGVGSAENIIGKTDYDLPWKKEETEWFREWDRRVMESDTPELHIIEPQKTADGKHTWVDTNKIPLRDGDGNVVGILGTAEDITERKEIEEALRQSQAKLQKLSANVPGMLYQFMLHPDGSFSFPFISSGSYQVYGLTPEEIQADPNRILSLLDPIQREKYEQSVTVSAQTLQPWHWEGQIVLPRGQVKWLQAASRPELQADESILWDGLLMDVTHIKQTEEALHQAYAELERRVEERTQELVQSNQALQAEIADRKFVEAALMLYKQAVESSHDAIGIADAAGNHIYQNSAFCKLYECETTQAFIEFGGIPSVITDPKVAEEIHQTILKGESWIGEAQQKSVSGRIMQTLLRLHPIKDFTGKNIGFLGVITDITDRKRAETQLQQQEEFLRTVFDGSENPIFVVDVLKDGEFCHVGYNSAAERATGFSRTEVIGKTPEQLHGAVTGAAVRQMFASCLELGKSITYEECLTFHGEETWWLTTINPLQDSEGRIYRLVGTTFNISDRKRAEATLLKQEQFLRSVFDGSQNPKFVVDVLKDGDFRIAGWNPATERATGLSSAEVIGKTPEYVYGAVEGARVRQRYTNCLKAGTLISYEECFNLQGEEICWLTTINPLKDSEGRIYRLVGIVFNLTERKLAETQLKQQAEDLEKTLTELQRTQMQLIQSEKMSGLGQLVAGVAHEINNPVNFIYGNLTHANDYIEDLLRLVQLYEQHYPDPVLEIQELAEDIDLNFLIEDLGKLLKSMKIGAERIQEIVLSLRTFSRMDEAEMKEVDIHEGLDSTLMILEHRIKAKPNRIAIEVIKEYGNLPLVECYAGQLNQVFMNILANAIDALEELFTKDSGQLITPQIRICTELMAGDRVKISIADNGLGISSAIKARLFDPFFTTKPIGKGTGMGLSISYQIISDRHGGSLECISQPGAGAEFVIAIPLCQR
ncbi:two-component sensor histidine kinase [Tolypothrix sp. NIES-4075]|uniref:PAS domain S-box protein n=1 Tax=Tolypothrix sp. NIES-4075 TaxID=2005459 RepID=UPI000B5CE8E8|nr:PAS domain S-box protein [Tolypothrix sp. NIES-4075]GAX42690.1 two-component sensor histidine kinase [Tolypothrix sp. NIES-4075]